MAWNQTAAKAGLPLEDGLEKENILGPELLNDRGRTRLLAVSAQAEWSMVLLPRCIDQLRYSRFTVFHLRRIFAAKFLWQTGISRQTSSSLPPCLLPFTTPRAFAPASPLF